MTLRRVCRTFTTGSDCDVAGVNTGGSMLRVVSPLGWFGFLTFCCDVLSWDVTLCIRNVMNLVFWSFLFVGGLLAARPQAKPPPFFNGFPTCWIRGAGNCNRRLSPFAFNVWCVLCPTYCVSSVAHSHLLFTLKLGGGVTRKD